MIPFAAAAPWVLIAFSGVLTAGLGLFGLIGRRPVLLSGRWMMVLIIPGMAPAILQPFWARSGFDTPFSTALAFLGPVLFLGMLVYFWFSMRGVLAFGVTETSFRSGLQAALRELELPYEETISVVKLPSVGAELRVAVMDETGTAQMKIRPAAARDLLGQIAAAMHRHYQSAREPVRLTCFGLYVFLGVVLLGLAVFMAMLLSAPSGSQ